MSGDSTNPTPRVLIPRQDLEHRVSELAAEIQRDYVGKDLVAVGVLKGSIFFMVDLLKQIDLPLEVDFLQTSSYSGTSRGEVRIRQDVGQPIRGRHVLLIEDIVDTGYTLRTVLGLLRYRGAASVKLCALLDKAEARQVEVPIDYKGFQIEDRFVIGYGLDYEEHYRNLPYIGILEEETETVREEERPGKAVDTGHSIS